MSFLDLVKKRYSVRNYQSTVVPRDKIERCIEAARLAPSACNSQPWKFVVVDEPELIGELAKAAFEGLLDFNNFAFKAPGQEQLKLPRSGSLSDEVTAAASRGVTSRERSEREEPTVDGGKKNRATTVAKAG